MEHLLFIKGRKQTMAIEEKITDLPCFHCGEESTYLYYVTKEEAESFYVNCPRCGTIGPDRDEGHNKFKTKI